MGRTCHDWRKLWRRSADTATPAGGAGVDAASLVAPVGIRRTCL